MEVLLGHYCAPTLALKTGEISTCFRWDEIDMLFAVASEILLSSVARRANSWQEFAKMKDEFPSLSESIQAFTRELALSLRRITGRVIEPDMLPVVHPTVGTEVPAPDEEVINE